MGFGFLDITLVDIIDIFVVALIMFQVYRLTRGTNALRIVVGILIIYLLWIVTRVLNMELLSMILGQIIGVGVIALIIVFQQEIRRFLILLGTQYTNRRVSFMARLFRPRGRKVKVVGQEWIDTVVGACADMAKTKTGALIVIARKVNLLPFIEQGERIDALISASLIKNIFFKNSPLHDGAMVIADDRIAAARCVLPSTEREVPMEFGMRHRAALGASEITDALEKYLYLDRLSKGDVASVHLTVKLDGETQGNDYQDTLASLQMSFAADPVTVTTVTKKGEGKVVNKTVTRTVQTPTKNVVRSPKTGDTTQILAISAVALASGVILLILAVVLIKKRKEGKGEGQR